MSENKTNLSEVVMTLDPVKTDKNQAYTADQDEQEALWKRSLQFFEAMNAPTQEAK